jgi:hypothetical protein
VESVFPIYEQAEMLNVENSGYTHVVEHIIPLRKKRDVCGLHYTASPFLPLGEICKQAGIRPSQLSKWKKNSKRFGHALAKEHRRSQAVANMSRKNVMAGILDAIDIAKDMRQPSGMITGWKEIGRMCGFYEPEKREITLSVNGQSLADQMKGLTREQLLEIASQQDVPLIEGEFEIIDEGETHATG